MLVLALDTTSRSGSIALARDETLLGVETGDSTRTHGERLPAEIVQLLTRHHVTLPAIDVYAVAAGPGSFTGLRIGIATMQGLAFANRKGLVGISALDALAFSAQRDIDPEPAERVEARTSNELIAAWMDARRHEVFAALYRAADLECLDGPSVAEPEEILTKWQHELDRARIWLIGDGAIAYSAAIAARSDRLTVINPTPLLAPAVAVLAARQAARGHAPDPAAIRPLYVRRSDAELARDRARSGIAQAANPQKP